MYTRVCTLCSRHSSTFFFLSSSFLLIAEGYPTYLSAADDAFVLVVAKGALVADANQSRRSHVAVANRTLAVAFVAEAADGDACRLAAHDQIAADCVSKCPFSPRERLGLLTVEIQTYG